MILALCVAPALAATPQGRVIARLEADLDGDGAAEVLELVMLSGQRVKDREPWCGAGEKWRGRFELRVGRGDIVLDRRGFAALFWPPEGQGEEAFFWAPLKIITADYNGDGRLDFNLGQYGSCNGNLYRIFGLGPDGRLRELPLATGGALFVSGAGRANSTGAIRARGGVISAPAYDNTQGKEITRRWRWDGAVFQPLP
ncbi:MAG: hypothetical protein K9K66_14065 [Desulfarculaceae bacterium]|nr:hypothetical protein [Desulfarculaceae bacterium]MCF8074197.1 hypothetical protein [Desulfarculaceae bacterium]MCF8102778.1 hypothetical protein [Desulfarculaceae bacterium]MCF8116367.1 hypothetical protein [Desulfarculaceae bacterium]